LRLLLARLLVLPFATHDHDHLANLAEFLRDSPARVRNFLPRVKPWWLPQQSNPDSTVYIVSYRLHLILTFNCKSLLHVTYFQKCILLTDNMSFEYDTE